MAKAPSDRENEPAWDKTIPAARARNGNRSGGYVLRVLQIEGGHDISLEVIWPVTEMERDHDPNKAG
jgi:hypothetical protein